MKKHITALFIALACAAVAFPQPAGTSKALREQISLNEDWRFQRQVAPGSAVEWPFRDAWKPAFDDSGWSRVFLPHSWDQTAHNPWVAANHWRGIGWYRKQFVVPQSAAGQRVLLEFEGASQVTKVWVNGTGIGEHVGGYTGFAFDVTDAVKPGQKNLLALRVDNTNSPDIPPANESNISIYGGLYRDVWLHITSPISIPLDEVAITTPEVSKDRSTNGSYFDFYKLAMQHPDWKWLWNEWGAYVNERGILTEPRAATAARIDTGNIDEYRQSTIPSELTAAIFQEANWLKFEAMPWMATTKWDMFDPGCAACNYTKGIFYFYGPPEERPWGTRFTGGDYRGLSDLWRIPKASYWFMKAQWTEIPFVHIVGHWTWPGREGKPKMVRIYSTCDEIELFLNGKSLGRKKPETTENLVTEWKNYGLWAEKPPTPPDTKLRHGPFIWKNVAYEPGILRAVGIKGGKEYVDERKTAAQASQIILKPDHQVIGADGRDAVRIVAIIADSNGVMVPSANPWLTFRAKGPARLLGTPVLDAVWGMAAINILSRQEGGEITITASSPGLKDGQCVITSKSPK